MGRGGARKGAGRKRKPTEFHKITGGFRPSRHGNKGPATIPMPGTKPSQPASFDLPRYESPPPPRHLSKDAKKTWRELCKRIAVLRQPNEKDLPSFEMLVNSATWIRLIEKQLQGLAVGSAERGRAVSELMAHKNYWKVQAALFGLDPSTEARVAAAAQGGRGAG